MMRKTVSRLAAAGKQRATVLFLVFGVCILNRFGSESCYD